MSFYVTRGRSKGWGAVDASNRVIFSHSEQWRNDGLPYEIDRFGNIPYREFSDHTGIELEPSQSMRVKLTEYRKPSR